MSLEVVFLGTAGSIPTVARSLPAVALVRKGELILFDCGEGVQRRMIEARLGFNKRMKILITHLHGDHVLGLPGLVQTMSLLGRTKNLAVYGPPGLTEFLRAVERALHFNLPFSLVVEEIESVGRVCEEQEYTIETVKASHSVETFAFAFDEKPRPGQFYPAKATALGVPKGELWSNLQHGLTVTLSNGKTVTPEQVVGAPRPGRKIAYTGDTRFSEQVAKLATNADLLIHECTFDDALLERALEDGHSTPSQAARTAHAGAVRQLVLTHVSARYEKPDLLLEQARSSFSNVEVAKDLLRIRLPVKARGEASQGLRRSR
jgi:ribonuclease Z